MGTGSFDGGLLQMADWLARAIMPVLAGLLIALSVYRLSKGGDFERYIWAALGCLTVTGLFRLLQVFAAQSSKPDQLFVAVVTLTDWVCNVIMPVFASLEIVRAVLGVSGIGSRLNIGDDWLRHVLAAFAALSCSGILRLLEFFVLNGKGGIV